MWRSWGDSTTPPWRDSTTPPWERWHGAAPVVALWVSAVQLLGTYFATHDQTVATPLVPWGMVLLAVGGVSLAFMNRSPMGVLIVTQITTIAYYVLGFPVDGPVFLALFVALVNAVLKGYGRWPWILYTVGLLVRFLLMWVVQDELPSPGAQLGQAAWGYLFLAGAALFRNRSDHFAEVRRRQAESRRREASEERLRIARELHDVLAHNVSLINVQASTALHLIDAEPQRARTALAAIKEASHETLQELRATVGALRQVDEGAPRAPTAGLARVDELVRQTSEAGLRVDVVRLGVPGPLPPRVDLAAYRIVQEALTNVRRHAGVNEASVTLTYGPRDLGIEVSDAGAGNGQVDSNAMEGHGLQGMRERAAALGGTLHAGPRPQGGWSVVSVLPVASDS
ncbi:MAG TPA: sensor histidine kinase [Acidothermales bacterium]